MSDHETDDEEDAGPAREAQNRITCPGARKITARALNAQCARVLDRIAMRVSIRGAHGFHSMHELAGEVVTRSGRLIDAITAGEPEEEIAERLALLAAASLIGGAAIRSGLGCEPRS